LQAAEECKCPVILGVSEGAVKYMCGYKNIANMVCNCIEFMNITVPVTLHLDHGTFSGAISALEAGFSSVMFDGSGESFEENIEHTKRIVDFAKQYNASVEAEVGGIGGTEDGVTSAGEIADTNECVTLSKTSIDCLAAGIGNIHGIYPSN
jgi:fructose-bisphosphate aldolase class II